MGEQSNGSAWKALEGILKAVAHVARAHSLPGPDRVARLEQARQAIEEALELVEHAIIEAEAVGAGGDGADQDADDEEPTS